MSWLEARTFYNGDTVVAGPSALGLATYQAVPALGDRVNGFFNQISSADVANWVMLQNGCFGQYNVETFLTANGYPAALLPFVEGKFATQDTAYFDSYNYNTQASNATAPGFHETGWWDVDVAESIKTWSSFNTSGGTGAAGNQWLVIGPWTHEGIRGDQAGILMFPNTGDLHDPQVLPAGWNGIEFLLFALNRNPFFTPPANKVLYYVVGPQGDITGINNSWQEAAGWPPPSLPSFMYLDAGNTLTDIIPVIPDIGTFTSDPANPVGTVGGGILPFGPLAQGPQDQAPIFAAPGSFLFFETAPLLADVTVAGDLVLSLRIELDGSVSQAADTDIAVRLMDEDGAGVRLLVADGICRLRDEIGTAPAVDTPYNITFSLGPRAYNFVAGHKLVLHVSGSNSPQYAVNPGDGSAFYDGSNGVLQGIRLHFGDVAGQSQLLLPIKLP
jgi:putative CocE/NonD family hydrolase